MSLPKSTNGSIEAGYTAALFAESREFDFMLIAAQGVAALKRRNGRIWRQWRSPKWRTMVDEHGHYSLAVAP